MGHHWCHAVQAVKSCNSTRTCFSAPKLWGCAKVHGCLPLAARQLVKGRSCWGNSWHQHGWWRLVEWLIATSWVTHGTWLFAGISLPFRHILPHFPMVFSGRQLSLQHFPSNWGFRQLRIRLFELQRRAEWWILRDQVQSSICAGGTSADCGDRRWGPCF